MLLVISYLVRPLQLSLILCSGMLVMSGAAVWLLATIDPGITVAQRICYGSLTNKLLFGAVGCGACVAILHLLLRCKLGNDKNRA